MHPVNVLDAVVHFDRNLLPREEAKVTLLQQGLQSFFSSTKSSTSHFRLSSTSMIFNTARSTLEMP